MGRAERREEIVVPWESKQLGMHISVQGLGWCKGWVGRKIYISSEYEQYNGDPTPGKDRFTSK